MACVVEAPPCYWSNCKSKAELSFLSVPKMCAQSDMSCIMRQLRSSVTNTGFARERQALLAVTTVFSELV